MCRKAHGAACGTYAVCAPADLKWLAGEDAIQDYRSSDELVRHFCRHCSSVLPTTHFDYAVVPVGNLDDEPGMSPQCHIFVDSKAPWHIIGDALPRHETWSSSPTVDTPATVPPRTGTGKGTTGSCLCGKVAFEVTEDFIRAHNCYCSRCRKGRSAAHASNAFTSNDGVRFLRGEDDIATYKLPDARFFTIAFCPTCGSGVPRLDPDRRVAVIPLGSLDDDPGRSVDSDIFIASAASWHPSPAVHPTFEEAPG